jgi:hypothetical protein
MIVNCDETSWRLYRNNILTWWDTAADDVSIPIQGDEFASLNCSFDFLQNPATGNTASKLAHKLRPGKKNNRTTLREQPIQPLSGHNIQENQAISLQLSRMKTIQSRPSKSLGLRPCHKMQ